jgi:NAD(P)H-hydrate epimerase
MVEIRQDRERAEFGQYPMKELVSCAEAGRLDMAVREMAALPDLTLMEDASLRLWDSLRPLLETTGAGSRSSLVALCGTGNNAGDALAVIRHVRFAGYTDLAVILGRDDPGDMAGRQLASLRALGIHILSWRSSEPECRNLIKNAGMLLDGLAGSGLHGRLRAPLLDLLSAVNDIANKTIPIATIDLPSGLGDDHESDFPLMRARWTLSIEPAKASLYFPAARSNCGEIINVAGIFPVDARRTASAVLLTADDLPVDTTRSLQRQSGTLGCLRRLRRYDRRRQSLFARIALCRCWIHGSLRHARYPAHSLRKNGSCHGASGARGTLRPGFQSLGRDPCRSRLGEK